MHRTLKLLALPLALVIAALLFSTRTHAEETKVAKVGEAAPAFELLGTDGKTHKLSDTAGKITVTVILPAVSESLCVLPSVPRSSNAGAASPTFATLVSSACVRVLKSRAAITRASGRARSLSVRCIGRLLDKEGWSIVAVTRAARRNRAAAVDKSYVGVGR